LVSGVIVCLVGVCMGAECTKCIVGVATRSVALPPQPPDTAPVRELQIVNAAELAAAFAAANYCVLLDGDTLPLRVGEMATDLEAYWPAGRYTFITAWNPASEPHSDGANETADGLLVRQLNASGVSRRPAWAEGTGGDWREPGWLLADVGTDDCLRLAQEFGQAGVLMWELGQPVRLRMMVPRPADAAATACIDWVE
jgi:hypothetical protein